VIKFENKKLDILSNFPYVAYDLCSCKHHRMVWVGRDIIDCLVPTALPWAGTLSTRPGCSKPHPTWPWTLPGKGHPQFVWATCSSASPSS